MLEFRRRVRERGRGSHGGVGRGFRRRRYTPVGRECVHQRRCMKRIDVTELQEKISNSAALNESLEVERDGCLVGYFLPIKKKDPEKIKAAIDRLDAAIEHALAGSTLTR